MGEISISIDKETLEITVEGHKFKGRECVKAIDDVVELLEGYTKRRKSKPQTTHHTQHIERG